MNKELNFKIIEDIFYYDGPILSLGITSDNQPVLQLWCDEDREKNFNLYAYIFISQKDFESFIQGKINYYQVLKNNLSITTFKYNGQSFDFKNIDTDYFMQNYGPEEDSSFIDEVTEIKDKFTDFITNKE